MRDRISKPGSGFQENDTETLDLPKDNGKDDKPAFVMQAREHPVLGAGVALYFEGDATHEFVPVSNIRRVTIRKTEDKKGTDTK